MGRVDPLSDIDRSRTRRQLTAGDGLTVANVARRYRVSAEKVRPWILRGELAAINTADANSARPRYVVPADALEQFEKGRSAALPPMPTRRKRIAVRDYYPDD